MHTPAPSWIALGKLNLECLTHPPREYCFARKVKRTSQTSSPRVSTRREGRAFKKREVLPFQMKTMTSGNCDFPLDAFSAFRSSFEKLSFRSLSVFLSFHLSVCLRAIIVGGLFYATLNFPPVRARRVAISRAVLRASRISLN